MSNSARRLDIDSDTRLDIGDDATNERGSRRRIRARARAGGRDAERSLVSRIEAVVDRAREDAVEPLAIELERLARSLGALRSRTHATSSGAKARAYATLAGGWLLAAIERMERALAGDREGLESLVGASRALVDGALIESLTDLARLAEDDSDPVLAAARDVHRGLRRSIWTLEAVLVGAI